MKKTLLMILTALCLQSMSFAQHLNQNLKNPTFNQAEYLIEENLKKNIPEIQVLSQQLTFDQKKTLIEDHKQDYTVPLLLNVLVPYGVGSFYQGDTLGGVIGLVGDVAGQAIIFGAYIDLYITALNAQDDYDSDYNEDEIFEKFYAYAIVGGAISTASFIFRLVRPITYAGTYNKNLKKAVPLESSFTFKMIPDLQLTSSGDLTPAVNFKISY
jgi:hypothetical protein